MQELFEIIHLYLIFLIGTLVFYYFIHNNVFWLNQEYLITSRPFWYYARFDCCLMILVFRKNMPILLVRGQRGKIFSGSGLSIYHCFCTISVYASLGASAFRPAFDLFSKSRFQQSIGTSFVQGIVNCYTPNKLPWIQNTWWLSYFYGWFRCCIVRW